MTKLLNKSLMAAFSLLIAMAFSPMTHAAENPFGMSNAAHQQMQVAGNDGKCGAGHMKEKGGKCGGDMEKKESKCGGDKKESKCGGDKKAEGSKKMAKCGEGKCGGK